MKLTEHRVRVLLNAFEEIHERIDAYTYLRYKTTDLRITCASFMHISVYNEWEEGCRGCYETKSEGFDIPYWIFNDDWKEQTLAILEEEAYKMDEEREKWKKIKQEEKAKKQREKEEAERVLFEALKAKFEP